MKCVLLQTNGTAQVIESEPDKLHIVLEGPLTFVGTVRTQETHGIALARRSLTLEENQIPNDVDFVINPFCETFDFDPTSSHIIIVETDEHGDPINLSPELEKILIDS